MASHDIFMPALSSTMTEGKIVEWLKKPGEKVARGESVLVVESDKADMDVEAFQEGFLGAILMPAGSTAPVGETIGLIVESLDEIDSLKVKTPENVVEEAKVQVREVAAPKTEEIQITQNNLAQAVNAVPKASSPNNFSISNSQSNSTGRIVATPKAKKLAEQLGVDLSTIQGTGPHGRIQADDVQKAQGQPITVPWVAESNAPAAAETTHSGGFVAPLPSPSNKNDSKQPPAGQSFGSPGQTIKFNTLQQAVNRNMEASLAVPCFRVGYTIDTDKFETFYKQVKPQGVTMTALLAKAVGKTLERHPQVNSSYSNDGIFYKPQINVAVAVAMEDGGLITPVLKQANSTDLFELSRCWADLVKRSRSKQLQPDEYSTGTFTLSNLGMFGVDRFDAILPPGTGAILAVASSNSNVVAGQDGSIKVKRQMQVNLTADHRVIYGADGASFLRDLAYLLENNPEDLLN